MRRAIQIAALGIIALTQTAHACAISDTLLGEAASEGRIGIESVACVMKARDWNMQGFSAGKRSDLKDFVARQPLKVKQMAMDVINDTRSGRLQCDRSNHYLTVELYKSSKCPRWAKQMRVTKIVGRHIFLVDK